MKLNPLAWLKERKEAKQVEALKAKQEREQSDAAAWAELEKRHGGQVTLDSLLEMTRPPQGK